MASELSAVAHRRGPGRHARYDGSDLPADRDRGFRKNPERQDLCTTEARSHGERKINGFYLCRWFMVASKTRAWIFRTSLVGRNTEAESGSTGLNKPVARSHQPEALKNCTAPQLSLRGRRLTVGMGSRRGGLTR